MSENYQKLIECLDARELRYTADAENASVSLGFNCDAACHRLTLWLDSDTDLLQAFGYVSPRAPEGCRPSVAESLARINYGLRVGKFELDFDSGDMRYHVAHILGDEGVTPAVVNRMIGVCLQMLDRYLPAILSVIYGNELPKDAIRQAEAVNASS